jgi:hypothetical protein
MGDSNASAFAQVMDFGLLLGSPGKKTPSECLPHAKNYLHNKNYPKHEQRQNQHLTSSYIHRYALKEVAVRRQPKRATPHRMMFSCSGNPDPPSHVGTKKGGETKKLKIGKKMKRAMKRSAPKYSRYIL